MAENKQSNFIRFLSYVRPYRTYILLAAIGGIAKFTVPLLVPEVTRYLLDQVYLNAALSQAEKLRQLYLSVGGLTALFIFVWTPLTYVRHYYAGKAGHRSVFDLRLDLYYRILRMSASFFDRNKSGSIVARLISDIELAQNLVGSALTNVWMDLAALLLILYFLLRIDAGITIVALSTFPIYIYFFRRLQTEIKSSSAQVQEEIASISGNIQEKIAGSRVVHAFAQEKREHKAFHEESEKLFLTAMRRIYYQSLNMTVTGIITQLAPLIVILFGGYQVITGRLSVGELVAVGMYLAPLYTPLQRFSELNVVLGNSMAALDRIFEIMDQKPEILDRPDAIRLEAIRGEVAFERVHFSYKREDAEEGPVLEEISFTARPGQKIALVGPSGSGKSSLISLIPRFYDVDAGAVRIDGHDVRDVKQRSLRRHIGMVLQNPILFSGTIRGNLLYGRPEATDQEIVAACKAANAYDFIRTLPDGFATEVGEGGVFLSGGQRQRLTIARAFLTDPKILILDEATSALDAESERLIQEALKRLMVGRTAFIIAHRLSTIVNADRILVLHEGRIVESGTHTELLRRGGLYRRLYEQQFASASASLDLLQPVLASTQAVG
ncbi:MAG TPA: ABC transporter ATP-binding protein [Ardenticatenaceae bacterium]|nr:ABC transporter ATP-binding protein [Ardenticatenaceae bacterium]